MHGGVHPREVGAPYWPRVARDGVRKKQLLDHDIIRLAGCVPQLPDSVLEENIFALRELKTCPAEHNLLVIRSSSSRAVVRSERLGASSTRSST